MIQLRIAGAIDLLCIHSAILVQLKEEIDSCFDSEE